MSKSTSKPAILLIGFNRIDTLQRVIQSISEYRPDRLYFACDGPRTEQELKRVLAVRKEVEEKCNWGGQLFTLYRDENLGCGRAVSSAISWFFDLEEEGIILEDDCVPAPSYFLFCEQMLEVYRDSPQIMMVSGTNYLMQGKVASSEHFLLRYFSVWGWATWRRAWQKYQFNMPGLVEMQANQMLEAIFPSNIAQRYYSMFNEVATGAIDTWDLQWVYTCLRNNGLSVAPVANLIANVGATGTHASGTPSRYNDMPVGEYTAEIPTKAELLLPNHPLETLCFANIGLPWGSLERSLWRDAQVLLKTILRRGLARFAPSDGPITLEPRGRLRKGRALVSYLPQSVHLSPEDVKRHSNVQECHAVVQMLAESGFVVDVISWDNKQFHPQHEYDLVFDIHGNLGRLASHSPRRTVFWLHLTGSAPAYANQRELKRVTEFEARTGVRYSPKRQADETGFRLSYRAADVCSLVGNGWTKGTYADSDKIHCVTISASPGVVRDPIPARRDAPEFLWFYGAGAVHKGLDLVLEYFLANPGLVLNIVGNPGGESDFLEAYKKALFHTPNIRHYPVLSPDSGEFREIVGRCHAFLATSCSEATSTAAVTCLKVGLFPVMTMDNGLDLLPGCGILMGDADLKSLEVAMQRLLGLDDDEVQRQTRDLQKWAIEKFTLEAFRSDMERLLRLKALPLLESRRG